MSDQACVAVVLARHSAPTGHPTVAHLLAGTAAEPEGTAGALLRERETAAGLLQARLATSPPGLADLPAAVHAAAQTAGHRPVDTVDLAASALNLGGSLLEELLESCGYDGTSLHRALASAADSRGDPQRLRETMGLPPHGRHPVLSRAAARVVAKVRAIDGGAVDVVLALAVTDEEPVFTAEEAEAVLAACWRLRKRGEDRAEDWDAGLDAVVSTAAIVRAAARASSMELLRAALLSGGRGPARLLQEAGPPR